MLGRMVGLFRCSVALPLAGGLLLPACGGGSDSGAQAGGAVTDANDGVYLMSAYTKNPNSCTDEGASVLADQADKFFFVKKATVFGTSYVEVSACKDAPECKANAAKVGTFDPFATPWSYQLSKQMPDGSLTGEMVWTGFGNDMGTCTMARIQDVTWTGTRDAVRLEIKTTHVPDHPQEGQFCTTEGTQAAAQGSTCSELEVIGAAYQEPF